MNAFRTYAGRAITVHGPQMKLAREGGLFAAIHLMAVERRRPDRRGDGDCLEDGDKRGDLAPRSAVRRLWRCAGVRGMIRTPDSAAPEVGFMGAACGRADDIPCPCSVSAASALPAAAERPRGCPSRSLGGPCGPAHDRSRRSPAGPALGDPAGRHQHHGREREARLRFASRQAMPAARTKQRRACVEKG